MRKKSDSKLRPRKIKKILGSGDNKKPSQSFKLPKGYSLSNLKIFVNNSPWERVDFFSRCRPTDRVYVLRKDTGEIQFGDGIHGARPPTGSNNVRASYTAGGGKAGNVGVGKAISKPQPKSKLKQTAKLKK